MPFGRSTLRLCSGRTSLLVPIVALASLAALAQDGIPAKRPAPFLRGMCLKLQDDDPDHEYASEVAEIASRLEASHVSIVFHLYQAHADSPAPARGDQTPTDAALRRVLRAARQHGLATVLMPIVLIEEPRPTEWRGKLAPPDADAWITAYRSLLLEYAKLAEEERVAILCVGSELGWSQKNALWRTIIKDVRAVFSGKLIYSANWDDYENVPFWDALDWVGLSGYYELAGALDAPDEKLREGWRRARDAILAWREKKAPGKTLVFTEVGYASQRGCSVHPWDYTRAGRTDADEQRRCYEAFLSVWAKTCELQGVFFYEWWGEGGPDDRGYTPRDKPAETVIRRFFSDLRVIERR
jgi:hypothetical protein